MKLGAKLADATTAGLTSAVTGGIGSIISGGLGLLGGLFKKIIKIRLIASQLRLNRRRDFYKEK